MWWAGNRVGGSLPFADRPAQSFVFSLDTSDFVQMGEEGVRGEGGGKKGGGERRRRLLKGPA